MIHNYFLELDQSPNHTMTYNPTITISNNDTYGSQKCLSNSRKIYSFTIMTLLQFCNDDFYNTYFWHDLILDSTLLLWTLAVVEVLLCLLQVMGLWRCIVFLVCFWVFLLCPPSCTRKTQTNIQTKYLHCPPKHMPEKYSKFKCEYVQNLWTKPNQTYMQNTYIVLPKKNVRYDIKIKIQTIIIHTLL